MKLADLLPRLEALIADAMCEAGKQKQREQQAAKHLTVPGVEMFGHPFPRVDFTAWAALDYEGVLQVVQVEVSAGCPAPNGDYLLRGEGDADAWLDGEQRLTYAQAWEHAFWVAFRELEGVCPNVANMASAWREREALIEGVPAPDAQPPRDPRRL